jgi:hypothetical protein
MGGGGLGPDGGGTGSSDGGEGERGGGSMPGGYGMGFPSRPTMPGMMRGGGLGGPGVGEGMPGMAGPGMPGAGGAAERGSTFTDTAHLVELSIYGIAALYERFPPRQKSDAPAAPAGSDATPTK